MQIEKLTNKVGPVTAYRFSNISDAHATENICKNSVYID